VDLTDKVRPSCVIMPDNLGEYESTRKDTMDFYQESAGKILKM